MVKKTSNVASKPTKNNSIPGIRGSNASLASLSYNGKRDLYQALGYPTVITLEEYKGMYDRNGVARRVVTAAPKDTWRGSFSVISRSQKDEQSDVFDKALQNINDKHKLTATLCRADILSGIGQFGLLVFGFDDGLPLREEIKPNSAKELLYIQPYSNVYVTVDTWDVDPMSARYGLPILYNVRQPVSVFGTNTSFIVHYSRCVHIAEEKEESDIFGTPRLQACWNYLQDLQKVSGGSSEMYWRNADPKLVLSTGKDATVDLTDEQEMTQKVDEFENNLRRWIITNGMDVKMLSPSLVDPSNHADLQLKLISAASSIPLRILTGSERGELASTQDKEAWYSLIEQRRSTFAEPYVLRPTLDLLFSVGILPLPANGYDIIWQDPRSMGQKEQAEVGRIKAEALSYYFRYPLAEAVMPFELFLSKILKLSDDDIAQIITAATSSSMMEQQQISQDADIGTVEQASTGDRNV